MAQNDYIIADQTASAALSDINSALQSLASCSSGSSEPSVKYANMLWYDTASNILKIRNEANSAWISMLYVHQSDNAIHVLDNTYISDTSGNHVGLLGDQATSEWTTGTGTTESLVSPAKIKAAILTLAPDNGIGVNQQWYNLTGSRSANTVYQNTTGRPIMVNIDSTATLSRIEASLDNVSWVTATAIGNTPMSAIIPNNQYYRYYNDNNNVQYWTELR